MGTSGTLTKPESVILFDGVCNLCSGAVQFVIKRDPAAKFKFASLQSGYGQQQLERFGLDKSSFHSIILIQGDQFFERSDAALEITRGLRGAWPMLYGFKIVPRFIRDGVYNLIGRNRYKLFGKKDTCWIPTPELKSRFKD
ncbi:MAG: thiol-disulfide oxidoreductase DCC family protein [Cyclobacteriaceae bacterium]